MYTKVSCRSYLNLAFCCRSAKESQLTRLTQESSHLATVNEALNKQIKELNGRIHILDCEVTEAKTLTNQNSSLHGTISLLKQQLDDKEQAIRSEMLHNEQFTKGEWYMEVLKTLFVLNTRGECTGQNAA